MRKYIIRDNVQLIPHENTGEYYNDNKNQPMLKVLIDGEARTYYFRGDDFKSCECGQRNLMFGYIAGNNSLNAFCIHCHKKQSQGVKQLKNSNARTGKHLYFVDHQKDLNRSFCEMCLRTEVHLKVHHIIQVKDQGDDEPENLQLLCQYCHDLTHSIRKIAGGHR